MINQIQPAFQVHTISDEYIGYAYDVDKAFKPAKSHAGEVELLCTYAPDEEYGNEGNRPYIAVQEDDDVFCAIDEFKENGKIDNVMELTPLTEQFLFKAKMEYYGDIMYFYAFIQETGFWLQAGLCLVYPKEYSGTEDEKTLMKVLDTAAESFRKI